MIVRKFLNWAQTASAGERAEGASALARAYLYADLSEQDFDDAELALTTLLDDSSPLVRRALAEALASAEDAPHHIIATLAADQSEVSVSILSRSPILTDAELVDLAAIGDVYAQSAVALRPNLSGVVCAALAEVGVREAVLALAQNAAAHVSDVSARRMIARFGADAELREALLSRPNVSSALRYDLARATANSLKEFVSQCGWMGESRLERVLSETQESSAILVAETAAMQMADFVEHLRDLGALTSSFLLRSLLTGSKDVLQAALVNLSQMPTARVAGFMRDPQGSGFAALFARSGLPKGLLNAFRAGLLGLKQYPATGQSLSRPLIAFVMERCAVAGEMSPQLMALLRRFEAEAARDAARLMAQNIIEEEKHIASSQRVGLAAVAAALDVPMLFEDLSADDYHIVDYAEAA